MSQAYQQLLILCVVCMDLFNTLRPRQNGRHFPDDIFKCIFLNENVWISIKISLKFVSRGPINKIPALVQIMAWLVYWRIYASLGLNVELNHCDLKKCWTFWIHDFYCILWLKSSKYSVKFHSVVIHIWLSLVQVMAWCRQATSHYLNLWWQRPRKPYFVIRPQWVNLLWQYFTLKLIILLDFYIFQVASPWIRRGNTSKESHGETHEDHVSSKDWH